MKNFLALGLLLGCFCASNHLTAQDESSEKEARIWLGPRVGITSTVLSFGGEKGADQASRTTTSSNLGISFGLPVLFKVSNAFSIETGLNYYTLQSTIEEKVQSGSQSATLTNKHDGSFISLPLLMNLGMDKPKVRLGVCAGLAANFLVGGKREYTNEQFNNGVRWYSSNDNGTLEQYDALYPEDKALNKLNKTTFSANLGAYLGLKTAQGGVFQLDARYNLSLAPMYEYNPTNGRNVTITVNSLAFSVAYLHPVAFKK